MASSPTAPALDQNEPGSRRKEIVDLLLVGTFKSSLLRLPYGNIQSGNRIFGQRSGYPGGGLLHPALGVEQKGAGKGDPLTGGQPLKDFNPVAQAPAGLDRTGLKKPIASINKDRFLKPGIEDRIHRYDNRRRAADRAS